MKKQIEKLSHDHAQHIKRKENWINSLKSNVKGLEKSLKAKTEKLQIVTSQLNKQNQQHLSKTGAENLNSNKTTETNQLGTPDKVKPKRKRSRKRGKKKKRALAEQNNLEMAQNQVESPEQNVSIN